MNISYLLFFLVILKYGSSYIHVEAAVHNTDKTTDSLASWGLNVPPSRVTSSRGTGQPLDVNHIQQEPSSIEADKGDLQHLLAWGREHAALHPAVTFTTQSAGGVGLVATDFISKGTVIARLPLKKTISRSGFASCKQPDLFQYLFNYPPAPPELVVTLMLLMEQDAGDRSMWSSYIKLLPKTFNSKREWGDFEQRLSQAFLSGHGRYEAIEKYFDRMYEAFLGNNLGQAKQYFDPEVFTRERLRWGFETILTRAWGLDNGLGHKVLIPVFDLANHNIDAASGAKVASLEFEGSDVLFRVTGDDYTAGEEIFTTYGHKSNSELLIQYGFALSKSPFNFIQHNVEYEITQSGSQSVSDEDKKLVQDRRQALEAIIGGDALSSVFITTSGSILSSSSVVFQPWFLQQTRNHTVPVSDVAALAALRAGAADSASQLQQLVINKGQAFCLDLERRWMQRLTRWLGEYKEGLQRSSILLSTQGHKLSSIVNQQWLSQLIEEELGIVSKGLDFIGVLWHDLMLKDDLKSCF